MARRVRALLQPRRTPLQVQVRAVCTEGGGNTPPGSGHAKKKKGNKNSIDKIDMQVLRGF